MSCSRLLDGFMTWGSSGMTSASYILRLEGAEDVDVDWEILASRRSGTAGGLLSFVRVTSSSLLLEPIYAGVCPGKYLLK
jgi:hypothetical protein